MTRTMAVRKQRAADRASRRATLRILFNRLDRLTDAEAAVLREYVEAEMTEVDQLRETGRGQDRALKKLHERLAAAEETIREVERDRDDAREELAAIRAYDRALSEALGPARPSTFAVGGTVCGTCRAWIPERTSLPHACPPPATVVVELLRDETGQPICTCTHNQRCPACLGATGHQPTATKEK
ncbi:hypothetical protein [Streptomyces sp. NPDC057854]|uniref:hypothetical protein n=1 Tax=unclassified Streptomyces TaxID=2593676 RepID=UPI00368FE946